MKMRGTLLDRNRTMILSAVLSLAACFLNASHAIAAESFVIAASPSLRGLLEQLSTGFERSHPDVRVKLYFDSGLDMRRTIAGMENSMVGQYFIGKGPIHLVAPGGDDHRLGAGHHRASAWRPAGREGPPAVLRGDVRRQWAHLRHLSPRRAKLHH